MLCFGRNKPVRKNAPRERCGNRTRFFFCRVHRRQPLKVLVFGITLAAAVITVALELPRHLSRKSALTKAAERALEDVPASLGDEERTRWIAERIARDLDRSLGDVEIILREGRLNAEDPFEAGVLALVAQDFDEAVRHLEATVALRTSKLDQEPEEYGRALHRLGEAYEGQGRTAKAVESLRTARRLLPGDLRLWYDLGWALQEAGEIAEAQSELGLVLQAEEKLHGEDTELGLDIRQALAVVLAKRGNLTGARTLLESLLEKRQATRGWQDRKVLGAMSNLGNVLHFLGEWDASLSLFEDAVRRSSDFLGENDPLTLKIHHNLIRVLQALGRADEARERQRKVLEELTAKLGAEAPLTLEARESLADLLEDPDATQRIQEENLAIHRRVRGETHPQTLDAKSDLAKTLTRQGDRGKALALAEEVYEERKQRLKIWHREALDAASFFGFTLAQDGQLDRALTVQQEALAAAGEEYGDGHPVTVGLRFDLATTWRRRGELDKALEMQTKVLEVYSRVYGADHPRTKLLEANRASTLENLERWQEALELRLAVLAYDLCQYGPQHTTTRIDAWNLLGPLDELERTEEANALLATHLCHLPREQLTSFADQDGTPYSEIRERCRRVTGGTWPPLPLPPADCPAKAIAMAEAAR